MSALKISSLFVGSFTFETSLRGMCFIVALSAPTWRSFVGEDVQQQLHSSTTVCVCVFLFHSVCQAVNCSIKGMLVEFCETHGTMAVVDEPDLPLKKLKCFACSLHGLVMLCALLLRSVDKLGHAGLYIAPKKKMPSHYHKQRDIKRITYDVAHRVQPCVNQVSFCLTL